MPRGGGGSARGYKPGQIYLRPGSRVAEALETLRIETATVGYALTPAEWRAAHERRTGHALSDLDSIAKNLTTRGFVTRLGQRARALRYTVTADPRPAPSVVDPYAVLMAIIREECARTGCAVPLDVIRAGLDAAGVPRTSDQAGAMLDTMATASPARIECLRHAATHWGRARRFWRPVGTTYPAPSTAALTRSDQLRVAVDATLDALQRPVSLIEIKVWARAHPTHPATSAVLSSAHRTRFTMALRQFVTHAPDGRATLRDCSHALASDGGIPLRVARPSASALELAAGRFTDACAWLRPITELDAGARLRARTADARSTTALAVLADVRACAMTHALIESVGVVLDDEVTWCAIAARMSTSAAQLDAWWQQTAKGRQRRTPRWLRDARGAADTAARIDALRTAAQIPRADLMLVGHGGLRSLEVVKDWLEAILRPEGRQAATPQQHLLTVRRFTNPEFARGPLYDATHRPFSLLDVGDVLLCLAELTSDGRLGMLLYCATDLLGSAVRDPRPLLDLMKALPSHDSYHRQGAVVALGALGVLVEPEMVLADGHDRAGLDAYALAVGLMPLTLDARCERLARLRALVAPPLRTWLEELIARARGGDTITIAM